MEPTYDYKEIALDPLPDLPEGIRPWPGPVLRAHELVGKGYNLAVRMLQQDDASSLQLTMLAHRLNDDLFPLHSDLSAEIGDDDWGVACAELLGAAIVQLMAAAAELKESEVSENVTRLDPVTIVRSGGRGRPKKVIDPVFLRKVNQPVHKITHEKVAKGLKLGRTTYYERRKEANLPPRYSNISDDDLDTLVRLYKLSKPNSGRNFTDAYLRLHGYRVQKAKLRRSLRRVDRLGQILRRQQTIQRGTYRVPGPNHLWHGDGHHKLIRYGIVIHGFIDGYTRTVTGIRANNNNSAPIVLDVFRDAVRKYNLPSRVRGDRGGENRDVAILMILARGRNRGSFLWGTSTRNHRIERLWLDVGQQFARYWRAFFLRLEELHGLDVKNPNHLWLLQGLFLKDIDDECIAFQEQWNAHSISTEGNMSPNDLWLDASLNQGVYGRTEQAHASSPAAQAALTLENVQELNLEQAYGAGGDADDQNSTSDTSASVSELSEVDTDADPDALSDDEWEAIGAEITSQPDAGVQEWHGEHARQIASGIRGNIRHDPIHVPRHVNPFGDDREREERFWIQVTVIAAVRPAVEPEGMNLMPSDFGDGLYPASQDIPLGCSRTRKQTIPLPVEIWRPRAVAWVQALHVLEHELAL